jgi:hypothetical protein
VPRSITSSFLSLANPKALAFGFGFLCAGFVEKEVFLLEKEIWVVLLYPDMCFGVNPTSGGCD